MIEYFIAMKHIFERKKQSIIATSGIALGITVLIVALGISNGLDDNMIKNILSMTANIKVTNSSVAIENYYDVADKIKEIKEVKTVMPRYSSQGIIKYSGSSGVYVSGILIAGVDSKSGDDFLKLHNKVTEGSADLNDLTSVVIGKELLYQLGASIGDKVKIISSENKEIEFKISGAFQSGFYDYDSTMVILPLKSVQMLSESDDIVTEINVNLKNVYDADRVAEKIKSKLGEEYETQTWGEANKNLLHALLLEKTVMLLVLSLIVIVACFVVSVILNTLVREKTKDIGILRSIGFSSSNVMKIFMIEGTVLGSIGIVAGIIMSSVVMYFLENYSMKLPLDIYYLEKLPFEISLQEILIIVGITFIIIFISSIFPAYRAAKLRPVEALKYD